MAAANNNLAQVTKNGLKTDEYWQKMLLSMIKILKTQYVFHTLGKELTIPQNEGTTTFSIRRYKHLPISATGALTELQEGVPSTPLKIEGVKVQGGVKQFGNWLGITDVTDDVAMDKVLPMYQEDLARVAVEETEVVTINSFAEGSVKFVNNRANATALTADDVLDYKTLRQVRVNAVTAKRQGHPKFGGSFVCVVHASVMQDLLDDPTLVDHYFKPGNEVTPIKNGSLETYKIHNMYVQETIFCNIEKVGEYNVYDSVFLGKDAYAVCTLGKTKWHKTPFKADKSDPLGQKATVGYTQWFGAKVLDPLAITVIKSRSKFDSEYDETADTIGGAASQV